MEQQNNKRQLTRSFGITYYGEDATESKALSVDYLESNIRIAIHRPTNNGDRKYDYKSGNEIYLREKSAKSLARLVKKAIDARDEQKAFTPAAISSGANLIEVSLGEHKKCKTDICITIYNNIDPESKKCTNYATFGFRNTMAVSNYNPETGEYGAFPIDSDISYFAEQLSEFAKAASGAHSHITKKDMKFDMDRIIARQLEVCNKLGITFENSASSKVSWNNSNNNQSAGEPIALESADILDEIDAIMD